MLRETISVESPGGEMTAAPEVSDRPYKFAKPALPKTPLIRSAIAGSTFDPPITHNRTDWTFLSANVSSLVMSCHMVGTHAKIVTTQFSIAARAAFGENAAGSTTVERVISAAVTVHVSPPTWLSGITPR